MNVTPVSLPFWVPFFMTGVDEYENGRETGGRMNVPPVSSALYTSAFKACYGRKGGTFSNALIFGARIIEKSHRHIAVIPS